jgi:hypothetical protein
MNEPFAHYFGLMKTTAGEKEAKIAWNYMVDWRRGIQEQADCKALLQTS